MLAGEDGCVAGADARDLRFDMIGNLQTNKINAVLGRAACIHSISSLHLAEAVSSQRPRREAGSWAGPQPVPIEANVRARPRSRGSAPMTCEMHSPSSRSSRVFASPVS